MNDLELIYQGILAGVHLGEEKYQTEFQLMKTREFGLVAENSSGADQKIILNPAYDYDPTAPGAGTLIVDGESAIEGLSFSSNGAKTIKQLLMHCKIYAQRVLMTQVDSNKTSQLSKNLVLHEKTLHGDLPFETISFALNKDNKAVHGDKSMNFERIYQMDSDTEISIVIPKGTPSDPTITTITLFMGAYYNPAFVLFNTARLAGARVV
jgi:hypothetical protein